MASTVDIDALTGLPYDRATELLEFDSTKAGVKGLVDAGLDQIPRIFVHPSNERPKPSDTYIAPHDLQIPVIDMKGIHEEKRREEVVAQVLDASSKWGFFQIIDHGVPVDVLDEMIEGVRRFNEQPKEVKMGFYTRDRGRNVRFSSNYDLFHAPAANWRDTLTVSTCNNGPLDTEELPQVCRDVMVEYIGRVQEVAEIVTELLSEGLGLSRHRLKETKGFEGIGMVSHYSPPCPQPHLTLATKRHTDPSCITILLQDQVGGLQILYQDHWVDVTPVHGALVVNIGDFLQILSNDLFKSANHRVVATKAKTRISVACFIQPRHGEQHLCGPLKELSSESNPPQYREIKFAQFWDHFFSRALDENCLDKFKLLSI